ncbi:MAG: O-antigen ligase family protein [Candidatus Omnitrophica bacterium]|nr:O-antigen ligase family protein [Candidatus Omnitrophota bacterium]
MPFRKNEGLPVFILEKGFALTFLLAPLLFGCVHPASAFFLSAMFFVFLIIRPDSVSAFYVLPKFFRYGMLAVFVFILFQAFFLSMNRHETVSELLRWTALAAGFLMIQSFPESSMKRLLTVIACAGVLEAIYGLFQTHSGLEMALWKAKEAHRGFVTGTYLNRNHLAGFLEMSLGIQLGFLLSAFWKKDKGKMAAWGLSFLISLTALIQTASRMGIMSFFLSFLFMAFFLPLPSKSKKIFFLFAFVLGGMALWHGWDVLSYRFKDLEEGIASVNSRFFVWQDALGMLRDHPWFGVGLGNFKWVFPNYQSERLLMSWDHAHQDYLELAIELGIPAAMLLFFSFAGLWISLFVTYCSPNNRKHYPLIWGALLGLLSFALHGLADFNFSVSANVMIFIFVLGILNRQGEIPGLSGKIAWVIRLAAFCLVILCIQRAWARPITDPLRLTQEMPFYGRGWLNLGLSRLQAQEASPDGVTSAEWPALRDLFQSAYQKEPGSAWVCFVTGRTLLSYPQYLSKAEKQSALGRLRKSASIHFPNQASVELAPILEFLWAQFSDFEMLKSMTPHDFASYQVLLKFAENHKLTAEHAELFPEFERMREVEYKRRVQQAEKWFNQGSYQKALDAYQEAYWIGQEKEGAKLGMQAAKARLEMKRQ